MNQQQQLEQKAKVFKPCGACGMEKHCTSQKKCALLVKEELSRTNSAAGASWMQGEGERLRESIDIEQLIPELVDKRVEEVMREAFGKTTIWDKTIYEGENAYYLSRKQIAEDLLDKFYIIPKPQTEHE